MQQVLKINVNGVGPNKVRLQQVCANPQPALKVQPRTSLLAAFDQLAKSRNINPTPKVEGTFQSALSLPK